MLWQVTEKIMGKWHMNKPNCITSSLKAKADSVYGTALYKGLGLLTPFCLPGLVKKVSPFHLNWRCTIGLSLLSMPSIP